MSDFLSRYQNITLCANYEFVKDAPVKWVVKHFTALEDALAWAGEASTEGAVLYFGINEVRPLPKGRKGGKKDVIRLHAVGWSDMDPVSERRPSTEKELETVVKAALKYSSFVKSKLSARPMMIGSGSGVQAILWLKTPIELNDANRNSIDELLSRWDLYVRTTFVRPGVKIDSLSNLDRVFALPGFPKNKHTKGYTTTRPNRDVNVMNEGKPVEWSIFEAFAKTLPENREWVDTNIDLNIVELPADIEIPAYISEKLSTPAKDESATEYGVAISLAECGFNKDEIYTILHEHSSIRATNDPKRDRLDYYSMTIAKAMPIGEEQRLEEEKLKEMIYKLREKPSLRGEPTEWDIIREHTQDALRKNRAFIESLNTAHKKRQITESELASSLALKNIDYLFPDKHGKPHAGIRMETGAMLVVPVYSRDMEFFVSRWSFNSSGHSITEKSVKALLLMLGAIATEVSLPRIDLKLKVCWLNGEICIDMNNNEREMVVINADGWRIEKTERPIFRRYQHQLPQAYPAPAKDGDVSLLDPFGSFEDDDERLLWPISIITNLIPDITHVNTDYTGQQGSVKTSTMNTAKDLIEPSSTPNIRLKRDAKENVQMIDHNYLPSFDNVSNLTDEQSDTLCTAQTGGGATTRTLYTDDDDFLREYKRPLQMNGIGPHIRKLDLLDRAIVLSCRKPKKRLTERTVMEMWKKVKPRILAGIYTALSKAMKIQPGVQVELEDKLPRMADYVVWGESIARALGHKPMEFVEAYLRKIDQQAEDVLAFSIVASALREFMADKMAWNGTMSHLLEELTESVPKKTRRLKDWPRSPQSLLEEIDRIGEALEKRGIIYERLKRTMNARPYSFKNVNRVSALLKLDEASKQSKAHDEDEDRKHPDSRKDALLRKADKEAFKDKAE